MVEPMTDEQLGRLREFVAESPTAALIDRDAMDALLARLDRAEAAGAWRPIDDEAKSGKPVDLWIEGPDGWVDFYAPHAKKVPGKALRHGRVTDLRWEQRGANEPNWYPLGGMGYPLSPDVTPTHYRLIPAPPALARPEREG